MAETYIDLGYDKTLYKTSQISSASSSGLSDIGISGGSSPTVSSPISDGSPSEMVISGSLDQILFSKKTSFTDTTNGWRQGLDKDGRYKWIIGGASSSIDWSVTTPGVLTVKGTIEATSGTIGGWTIGATTLTGGGLYLDSLGVIRYGKTSFSDTTHAGYYISTDGIYIGATGDVSKLKYTIADGSFDFVGTVSSRSTLTIANAIDAGGNLVTDIINARLDSSAKKILSDFDFGTTDYAGAVKSGTVTWDTNTGAITGGSGVIVYRGGIVGVNNGTTTFSIDATTGNAMFAGTLSAVTGSLGSLTVNGSIEVSSSGNIHCGQTAFQVGKGWWMDYNNGNPRFSLGDFQSQGGSYLYWNGSSLHVYGGLSGAFSGSVVTNLLETSALENVNRFVLATGLYGTTPTVQPNTFNVIFGTTRILEIGIPQASLGDFIIKHTPHPDSGQGCIRSIITTTLNIAPYGTDSVINLEATQSIGGINLLYLSNAGNGRCLNIVQSYSNPTYAPIIVSGGLTSTYFRRLIKGSNRTIWESIDSTSPNTRLSGTAGDLCMCGDGNIYRCTGGSTWVTM
jgi:hypothetical protein